MPLGHRMGLHGWHEALGQLAGVCASYFYAAGVLCGHIDAPANQALSVCFATVSNCWSHSEYLPHNASHQRQSKRVAFDLSDCMRLLCRFSIFLGLLSIQPPCIFVASVYSFDAIVSICCPLVTQVIQVLY